jgi:hypothetical protein
LSSAPAICRIKILLFWEHQEQSPHTSWKTYQDKAP